MTTESIDVHQENYRKTLFGFWVYLMTDCILFGMLFATFAVLQATAFPPHPGREIFSMPFMLIETLLLLASSFVSGLVGIAANKQHKSATLMSLVGTFVLGASFVGMELFEFVNLVHEGHSWKESAFLSSYFTLVGTHGLHVSFGLIWIGVMSVQVYCKELTWIVQKRLACFRLFWHFLDVVWIFIFTFVYLIGAA